MRMLA